MPKDFSTWCTLKQHLDESGERPHFGERDVWWCHLGANIGVETDGVGNELTRPVLVIRKFNRQGFYALPLTTRIKQNPFHYSFPFKGRQQAVLLTQLRLLDSKRLIDRIGRLPEPRFAEIKKALSAFL